MQAGRTYKWCAKEIDYKRIIYILSIGKEATIDYKRIIYILSRGRAQWKMGISNISINSEVLGPVVSFTHRQHLHENLHLDLLIS